ncbi:methyl-accepting chemotaxis protein [Clostridium sp. HBUAS56017]|uniref:methyl-accepting chemotaxis protein n=1 Tax=Clostridium sp. HBUAS56017 TaxID=2571128 RepID=UPI0011786860|nr:methyl-accepting chemotaxis protein [Clostridium sp. HBUAS56017]
MRKKKSLKATLMAIIISLAALPVIVMGVTSGMATSRNTQSNFVNNGTLLMSIAKDTIEERIKGYEDTLETVIRNGSFTDLQKLKEEMGLLKDNDNSILNIYYADEKTGSMTQVLNNELPAGYDPRIKPWYKDSVSDKSKYVIHSPYQDILTGKFATTIYKAVFKDNSVIGVMCIDIDLNGLADKLSSIKYGETGELIIADKDGLVVSNSDMSKIGGQEPKEYEIWNNVLDSNEGNLNFNYNGTKYEGHYDTSEITGWKLMLKIPSSELRQDEKRDIITTIVILIILIIISSLISVYVARKVGKSINILKVGMEKAAKGEFDSDIHIHSETEEFVVLEHSFNEMRSNISTLIRQVDDSVKKLNENTNNSADMSEDIASSMGQVSNTITEISSGTMESATGLENISGNMDSLSNGMDKIKDGINRINDMAKETNRLGEKGISVVKTVMDKSNETKKSTEEVSKVVSEVSNSVSRIEEINKAIRSITEETSILALNAAIEAARAGEAGKGFAVVSEEVRKLAEETAISAKQIDEIINEINDSARLAVAKVANTTNTVNTQEEAVAESQEIFTEIVSSIEELSNKFNLIVNGAESINTMKDEVVNQVENLSSILEETAAGTEEVTASAEEVSASTDEFVHSINELKDMANILKEQVSKFKF